MKIKGLGSYYGSPDRTATVAVPQGWIVRYNFVSAVYAISPPDAPLPLVRPMLCDDGRLGLSTIGHQWWKREPLSLTHSHRPAALLLWSPMPGDPDAGWHSYTDITSTVIWRDDPGQRPPLLGLSSAEQNALGALVQGCHPDRY